MALKFFNVLGQEIVTLVDREIETGKYSVVFDANDLPKDLYLYSLSTFFNKDKNFKGKKMIRYYYFRLNLCFLYGVFLLNILVRTLLSLFCT